MKNKNLNPCTKQPAMSQKESDCIANSEETKIQQPLKNFGETMAIKQNDLLSLQG